MTTPIDVVKNQIDALLVQREDLYKQFAEIERQLKDKQTLLSAFVLVSRDINLYKSWQEQANQTDAPTVSVSNE